MSDSTFVVSSSGTDNAGCVSLPQNNDCNTIQYIFDNVDLTGGYTIRVDDNQTLTADIVFGSNDSGTTGNPLILEGLNNQVTIDGNSAVSNVIDTSGEDHLIIRNLRITGSTSRGVFVQSNGGEPLDEIELDNLYIYENDGVGLHIKGSSATNNIANNAITVTDCSFVDNGNHGAFTGGHTGATAPVTYTNCTATNNTWHGFSSKSEEELLTGGGNWGTGNDYDHDISNESRSGETIYRVTNETTGAIGTEVACGALDANNEWCQDGDTLYWYHDTTDPDT
ncbi:MAG: hypothetical protein GWN55_16840, partial [Phycisphaerae bacterium]|nr:hypothetical protein [Phycisphaerae bacterium]NIS54196.1 hypothetical protein [Phycisphaerae bacterium]NIV02957.1 hypothetical protein [Phycisphaerae bacterium]NIW50311.1 hypothetical protein [Gammaproteobacteria bacterium]NIX01907.1 hypothetical protein [Phycisphaerae bacterium]